MAPRRRQVRITANFEANMLDVERYLVIADAGAAFDALLDELVDTVIPNLERHPRLGRPFPSRPPQSIEATGRLDAIRKKLGAGELREYVAGDYLILYAVVAETIHLLSVKHHRQLSFDLAALWLAGGSRVDVAAKR